MSDIDSSSRPIGVVYIEDDQRIAHMMAKYLATHGIAVTLAFDGREGVDAVRRERPAAVLLDLMLPHMDGIEVCQKIRAYSGTPIIMITARSEEADRVMGLEGGADDYVVKPCSPREILARIRAQLRRATGRVGPRPPEIRVDGLCLDASSMSATLDESPLLLTTYEFMLLQALAERAGYVQSREQLVDLVRGDAGDAFDRSIDVHICHLRRKLNDDPRNPQRLKTIRGVGYMLVERG